MTNLEERKYIINGIGSGEKLWRCEVCGGDVHRMFFQIELQLGLESERNSKWVATSNCRNLLGHKECLIGMRR
jgi:hypothetical protein